MGMLTPMGGTPNKLPRGGKPAPSFQRVEPATATDLGVALASMDPWRTLGVNASALTSLLLEPDEHLRRDAMYMHGELAGVVAVRSPWLYGPYVALLAVLPDWQGRGIGSAVLRRIEEETKPKNVWVCVSSFNQEAQRFYTRNGFAHVGPLLGLLRPEFNELLMRKRLA
jgi:ribosomal protein S18 acetylase RimI-like enzyme